MKTNFIFGALIAVLLALSHTFGVRGTTPVMLLVAGTLYIFVEMNREMNRFVERTARKAFGGKMVSIESHEIQRRAA